MTSTRATLRKIILIWRDEGTISTMKNIYQYLEGKFYTDIMPQCGAEVYHKYGLFGTALSIVDTAIVFIILMISINRKDLRSLCDNLWWITEKQQFSVESIDSGDKHIPREFETVTGEWDVPELFVCEIEDATIFSDRGILLTAGRPILEAFTNSEASFVTHIKSVLIEVGRLRTTSLMIRDILRGDSSSQANDIELGVSLITRHPTALGKQNPSYSHWVHEDLTKLYSIEKYCEMTGQRPTLLINKNPPSWMVQTLQLLGYEQSDWIEYDGGETHIERLVVPQSTPTGSFRQEPSPEHIDWVRDKMLNNIDFEDIREFSKYVYKSRQGTSRRNVSNRDELMYTLSEYGFEDYAAEKLTVQENIKMCAEAEIVVSPVGTGLTDTLFNDDLTIIELFNDEWIPPFNFVHSNIYGFDYYYIIGNAVSDKGSNIEENHLFDIQVDISELRHRLNRIER